jgi:ABC-type phosphate transport system substrate-binding protein
MRTTTGLRLSAAAAGAVCALAILPGGASAAFDAAHDAQCENTSSIAGVGASFQRQAHLAWGAQMLAPDPAPAEDNGFGLASTANGGCADFGVRATAGKKITFEPRGSGNGRAAMGAVDGKRNTAFHFAAADEPPSPTQLAQANQGPTAATTDDAVLLTVPVAQSSVATVVKLPVGCTVPAAGRQMTREQVAGAFAATANYTTWGAILTDIAGPGCAEKPVVRVVRRDSSGTTFAFKNYLRDVSAASAEDFPTSQGNTTWPNASTSPVVRGAADGAGPLLDALNGLDGVNGRADGGIGYADLAAARDRDFDSNVIPGSDPNTVVPDPADRTFWVDLQRRDRQYESPALSDTRGTANTGANCRNTTYQNGTSSTLPAVTESWSNVNANASVADYALCTLTYELVWQDMLKANAGIAADAKAYEQGHARAVKDYLGYILNPNGGQAALAPNGYQGLPPVNGGTGSTANILAIAQAAQDSLTWNGSPVVVTPPPGGDTGGGDTGGGDTGGGDTGGGNNTGGNNTGGGTTPNPAPPTPAPAPAPAPAPSPAPAAPAKPAAKVTVSRAVGVKGRRIALTVSPSAAGKLMVTATTRKGKKRLTIGKGTLTVKKGGKLLLVVTPSRAGKRALTPGRTEKVTFKVTFTAKTGKKTTVTKTVKVKIKR